ncbi:hypothetical protein [Asticcacaulis sp. AC402]|uniref:hypothetical protein n=1 Tax=Asticcacaulis sp. AC402 TaxID=1282361 RepID=UPI0003C404A7|nr:hypothetical protein [Asticcacaulis sp. AC402]ESQ77415.1 hypothetical protein ABAC402_01360 [Asticcacaulis sp. AC402]
MKEDIEPEWLAWLRTAATDSGDRAALINHRVEQLLRSGVDRQDVLDGLEVLRAELRELDDEPSEDVVMDVMDRFYGWCHPDYRL